LGGGGRLRLESGEIDRRSDGEHGVLLHELRRDLGLDALGGLEKSLEAARGHGSQELARLLSHVPEGVWRILRDEDERAGRCHGDAVTELERKLAVQDIEEFVLFDVDVQGRTEFRCCRVTPRAQHAVRLLACREDLRNVRLVPDRPREPGSTVGTHDEPLRSLHRDR
jgi:hypothetical protein